MCQLFRKIVFFYLYYSCPDIIKFRAALDEMRHLAKTDTPENASCSGAAPYHAARGGARS